MITVFAFFAAGLGLLVIALTARYESRRAAIGVAAVLTAWTACLGGLAGLGILQNTTMRPPGTAFVVFPVAAFLVVFTIAAFSGTRLSRFPLGLLLAGQSFRIVVELLIHQLWREGFVPRTLTYRGANVDLYIGLSAPLVAWLWRRSPFRSAGTVVLLWNLLGLAALANVVVRAVLTAPGPLNVVHAEVPNLMIQTFPFVLIPGFFVPLAVVLHVLAIRSVLLDRQRNSESVTP